MQNYLKFLSKLPKPLRAKLIAAVRSIAQDELAGFDVKKLKGHKQFYRCRVGKIRIIFKKAQPGNLIVDIGYRGDIYD